jgi:hypothetical protein
MEMNQQRLEILTIQAYNEFYTSHRELFKEDIQEYWRQAIDYKERQLRSYEWDSEKNGPVSSDE